MDIQAAGLDFLVSCQLDNGSFTQEVGNISRESPFFTSIITCSLSRLPESPAVLECIRRAAAYLESQRSPTFSFNYLPRGASPSPYPDDLDDTFCALAALTRANPSRFTGEAWGHIASLLTATEVSPGGPYKTWLMPVDATPGWQDVDIAVNCNIQYFLNLHDIRLASLQHFLDRKWNMDEITSPYYPEKIVLLYFLARASLPSRHKALAELVCGQRTGNPLQAALKILALNYLGSENNTDEETEYVRDCLGGGICPANDFCLDHGDASLTYMAGSSALTASLCLEALNRNTAGTLGTGHGVNMSLRASRNRQIVKNLHLQRCVQLEEPLRSTVKEELETFWNKDADGAISLLPLTFHQSLLSSTDSLSQTYALCVATTCGWIAYTIFDDFMDDQGKTLALPVASFCHRELTRIFESTMGGNPSFVRRFHITLDAMDAANSFELTYCRYDLSAGNTVEEIILPVYPSRRFLARRSAGHALGPLAVLSLHGFAADGPEVAATTAFFENYLAARQLNDDAHDWEEDLAAGRLSYVVTQLLEHAKTDPLIRTMPVRHLAKSLRSYFWQEYILAVSHEIEEEIALASGNLAKMATFLDATELARLLKPLENAAQKAILEHQNVHQFLGTYNSPGRRVQEAPSRHLDLP
jgi:hypothetical protein